MNMTKKGSGHGPFSHMQWSSPSRLIVYETVENRHGRRITSIGLFSIYYEYGPGNPLWLKSTPSNPAGHESHCYMARA